MFAIGGQPTIRLSHVKRLSRHKPSACMRLTKYQYKRLQADIGGLTTLYAIIKAEKNKEKEPKPRVRFRFLLAEVKGFALQRLPSGYAAGAIACSSGGVCSARVSNTSLSLKNKTASAVLLLILAEVGGFALQRLPSGYAAGAIACSSGDVYSARVSNTSLSLKNKTASAALLLILAEREGFALQRLPSGYAAGAIACSSGDVCSARVSNTSLSLKNKTASAALLLILAEREGFEPSVRF